MQVIDIMLGEYAETNLVKVPFGKLFEGLVYQLFSLQRPDISRRSNRKIRSAVLIGKMAAVDTDRTVISLFRRCRGKRTGKGFVRKTA